MWGPDPSMRERDRPDCARQQAHKNDEVDREEGVGEILHGHSPLSLTDERSPSRPSLRSASHLESQTRH